MLLGVNGAIYWRIWRTRRRTESTMSLITLETIFSPIEAEVKRATLDAAGIEAVLFDAGIASLIGSGLSGVRLMVLDEDADAARAVLAQIS